MILTVSTALLYPLAIQYKKGGAWEILRVLALITAAINVVANYTELTLIFGWPRAKEFTISRRVRRMIEDPNEAPARRELARLIQVCLDACEKDGKH